MSELPTHPPGHPSALASGCKCSPSVNRDGQGACMTIGGETRFVIYARCPMHGEKKKKGAA